jgi:putative ABC transport system permease protein
VAYNCGLGAPPRVRLGELPLTLALATILYEWRRYMAAVIALAVAGLLVLAMAGLFMGLVKSNTATIDRSPAHVLIMPPGADNLFSGGQPRRVIPLIYQHPDVLEAQALNLGFASWSNYATGGQAGRDQGVAIVIVDPVRGSVTLPEDFGAELVDALQEPRAVVIDRSSLGSLGVALGDRAKINKQAVWVRGVVSGYPSMFQPMVFMSTQTARMFKLYNDGARVGVIVARIRHPEQAQRVVDELNAMSHDQYRAWTRAGLSAASQRSLLKEGFIIMLIGFMTVVGAFIGIVITWQTLQGAILASIREFASLRAVGVSMRSLRLVVMELSAWVGVAGLLAAACLAGLLWAIAHAFGVPMEFPLFIAAPVAAVLFVVALLAGALSLGILRRSQPADLLR